MTKILIQSFHEMAKLSSEPLKQEQNVVLKHVIHQNMQIHFKVNQRKVKYIFLFIDFWF